MSQQIYKLPTKVLLTTDNFIMLLHLEFDVVCQITCPHPFFLPFLCTYNTMLSCTDVKKEKDLDLSYFDQAISDKMMLHSAHYLTVLNFQHSVKVLN